MPKTKPAPAPIARPTLQKGEAWAGLLIEKGKPMHHLVLLPAEPKKKLSWTAALDWAKKAGGELPNRRELRVLWANAPECFKTDYAYWSAEQSAADSDYAWGQWFDDGNQLTWRKSDELRARAVRRVLID